MHGRSERCKGARIALSRSAAGASHRHTSRQANAGLTNHPSAGAGEFPPEALCAGMGLLEVMRDVFLPSDAEWLTDRFRLAAKSRWSRLALSCDDGHNPAVRARACGVCVWRGD